MGGKQHRIETCLDDAALEDQSDRMRSQRPAFEIAQRSMPRNTAPSLMFARSSYSRGQNRSADQKHDGVHIGFGGLGAAELDRQAGQFRSARFFRIAASRIVSMRARADRHGYAPGRRASSKLPRLIDLVLSRPLVSTPMIQETLEA